MIRLINLSELDINQPKLVTCNSIDYHFVLCLNKQYHFGDIIYGAMVDCESLHPTIGCSMVTVDHDTFF